MWFLTYKNYSILCWGWLHMWTKFVADWSKIATCITQNVTISFKDEYRRHTLTSRCDVIGENHFGGWFTYYLFILDVKLRLYWKLRIFLNWRKFEVQANFFVISVTGCLVCYLDSQSNLLHFELLIEVLAKKLTELWQFQNLTYFLTSWPS